MLEVKKQKNLFKNAVIFISVILIAFFGIFALSQKGSCAGGDVAGVVTQTYDKTKSQVKTILEKAVFPAISIGLAIALVVKAITSYFDYKKTGQFNWTPLVILFISLIVALMGAGLVWQLAGQS